MPSPSWRSAIALCLFNISCGSCWTCDQGLHSQCETTQNHDTGTGASLLGYSKLYGSVPGGQAEYLRVQFANFLPIKVPDDGTLLVMGAGPIGDMAARIALLEGHRVIVADRVPERLDRVRGLFAETIDIDESTT